MFLKRNALLQSKTKLILLSRPNEQQSIKIPSGTRCKVSPWTKQWHQLETLRTVPEWWLWSGVLSVKVLTHPAHLEAEQVGLGQLGSCDHRNHQNITRTSPVALTQLALHLRQAFLNCWVAALWAVSIIIICIAAPLSCGCYTFTYWMRLVINNWSRKQISSVAGGTPTY